MNVEVKVHAEAVSYVTVTFQVTDDQWNDYLRPLLEAGRQHVKFEDVNQRAHALSLAANLISAGDRSIYDVKADY
jgi:hypothetical protein